MPELRTAAVVVNLVAGIGLSSKVCYQIVPGAGLSALTRAAIFAGNASSTGPLVAELFNARAVPKNYSGCVYVPLPVIRNITGDLTAKSPVAPGPNNYYVQLYTAAFPRGAARGQIVYTPHLFSVLKSGNVVKPVKCSGVCSGFVDLSFATFGVNYQIGGSRATGTLTGAAVYTGAAGANGPTALNISGPGITTFSYANGVGATVAQLLPILANPAAHYFLVGSKAHPTGVMRGQLSETLTLTSLLSGKNELPHGSGLTATSLFTAELGGGAVCFRFSNTAALGTLLEADIHVGASTARGAIVIPLFGLTLPITASGCVPAQADLTAQVLDSPSNYYVQIYTKQHPLGALRGQLTYA